MKKIDINNFSRKQQFEFYKNFDLPQYNVCCNIEITNFIKFVKTNGLPFYYSFMYYAMKVINEIDEFKYRIINNEIVYFDQLGPSFTDLIEGTENFKIVTIDMKNDLLGFIKYAKSSSINQGNIFLDTSKEIRNDLVYISCLPWVTFTSLSHAINFDKNDAIPRLTWGKFFSDNDKVYLPLSVQVHHAFVDGLIIGKYINHLQEVINGELKL